MKRTDMLSIALMLLLTIAAMVLLGGCRMTRDEVVKSVQADLWPLKKIPARLCFDRNGNPTELWNHGVARVVSCSHPMADRAMCEGGRQSYEEYIPYCDDAIKTLAAMRDTDRKRWLDLLRKEFCQ